ncbi:probable trehalase isoform X1 [Malania oleifera]|uniref:probable trehalase isoform X1 n=1 Tax=Malania oleifera TaxID=397392 RepID=UPI0025AEC11D|nr:probable trehalase isoform X1 [Malania oleifera]
MSASETPSQCNPPDSGPVKPSTPLVTFLQRVQKTALNTFGSSGFDPKRYVDLSLKFDLSTTEKAFNSLPRSKNGSVPVEALQDYLGKYFHEAGDDLVYFLPANFVPTPEGFLPAVKHPNVRAWALEVHSLWKNLSRRVSDDVRKQPDFHTLLPLPAPVVIPGSRFLEVYYWDSYWVIRGLLASQMYDTAKAIVTNLLFLIDQYTYVLNGARTYYTNRSQPPLLSAMIRAIYNRTADIEFVRKSLPALLKEYEFWRSDIHEVTIQDAQGCIHHLSRYYAMWNKPRPESYTIDYQTASKLLNDTEKQKLYRELASAAESGWDFSSRWMRNSSDLTTLATTSIIPVDLNAFILGMEIDITFLANVIGNNSLAARFSEASQMRKKAMNSVFWNEKMQQWLDYWLSDSFKCKKGAESWKACNQNQNIFASNFIPLWIESFHSDVSLVGNVMKSFQSSGLLHDAGIATSLTNSGQQWDFLNGWAPIQHMIIEGLVRSGLKEARSFAEDIAVRWLRSNYAGYKKTGAMHEKYDVEACGKSGGGGEYITQTGFGWTNGVALALLEEFGWPQNRAIDCPAGSWEN